MKTVESMKSSPASASRSVWDFGRQWSLYPTNPGYYGSLDLLADLVEPLLSVADFKNARVADVGSGTGRCVRMLAQAGATHILAVEPSASIEILKRNTLDLKDRITYSSEYGEHMPATAGLDFVVSFGVLHHIPNPAATVRRAHQALRSGGRMVAWLYALEGNEVYLALARPLRAITTRMPDTLLLALCRVLDIPLVAYMKACGLLPLPQRRYMQAHLARLPGSVRRLTIFDQLNPIWAKYYSRAEAVGLLADAGFINIRTHHRHGYSWTVVGQKP